MINRQSFLLINIFLFLVLDLLISVARSGFFNSNLARLLGMREQSPNEVNRAISIFNAMPRLQASLRLSQFFFRFLIAGLTLLLFLAWRSIVGQDFLIALIILLVALAVFCLEWTVERLVTRSPESWALRLAPLAKVLMIILAPLVYLPLKIFKELDGGLDGNSSVTEDELMSLVDAGQQEGLLEKGERKMIYSIFKLGDTLAREIMVPRIDILALEVDTPFSQAVNALLQSGYSRVPVFRESVDNILGLLYAKDLLRVWREGNQLDSLKDLLRPAYFVPEAKKVDELLAEIQAQRIHMAIVVDEYGGVAGLVTLEDIVEEIVGEILDEYDQAEELLYKEINESEFIFQGRTDLDDVNDLIDSQLPKDEADTLGGLIFSRIGRVPSGGESVEVGNLILTVEQVAGRRIRKVRVQRINPAAENGEKITHVDG